MTIAITTLLLVASAKALWLVVPLLIAIILYYMMYPIVRRLTLAGMSREAAAALVAGGVTIVGVAILVPLLPWLAGQAVGGEETLYRYLEGGRVLIDRTLAGLEKQFAFLQRMNFHAEMGKRAAELGDTVVQQQAAHLLLAAAASAPSMLLAPFFAFFFLRDGQLFTKLVTREVPNAFFERTILMFDRVDATARNYFQGLLKLTAIDTVCLGIGLWFDRRPGRVRARTGRRRVRVDPDRRHADRRRARGAGGGHCAAERPVGRLLRRPALFVFVRMLDNFFFIPLTVGRSIQMHPLPTVLMVFIGGAVAGIPGLILALPVAGVVTAIVSTIGGIVQDPRLRARNAYARQLLAKRVNADFGSGG